MKCGKCAKALPKKGTERFAVRVGTQWIERFTYPASTTKLDKAWEKSEGIQVAQCCKAVLGDTPFVWPNGIDSAAYTARSIAKAVAVPICDGCPDKE